MILIARVTPFLLGIASLLLMLCAIFWPEYLAWCVILLVVAVVAMIGRLCGWGRDLERWGHVVVTPLGFVLSLLAFTLFLESSLTRLLLVIVAALFLFLYTEHLFRFIHLPGTYQPYALEHSSLVLHVATMYLLSATFFGLQTFLQVPVWALALLFGMMSGVLMYETLWMGKIRDGEAVTVAATGALMLGQLFFVIAYLPTSLFVNATALAVLFYVLLGLVRAELLRKLSPFVLRRYLVFGGAVLVLIFMTARWI